MERFGEHFLAAAVQVRKPRRESHGGGYARTRSAQGEGPAVEDCRERCAALRSPSAPDPPGDLLLRALSDFAAARLFDLAAPGFTTRESRLRSRQPDLPEDLT